MNLDDLLLDAGDDSLDILTEPAVVLLLALPDLGDMKPSPSSTKATWYWKPGAVFNFSISGGADWSYCSGVIPETLCRTRTAMTRSLIGWVRHYPAWPDPDRSGVCETHWRNEAS